MSCTECLDDVKYNAEAIKVFPAKGYLERFGDPKNDPTKSMSNLLKAWHSFYENHVSGMRDSISLLEFGGGPTIYSLISAAKYVESITFAEYAETNRDEVVLWKDEKSGRHDWSKFTEYVVKELEGDTTEGAVERREKEIREKIKEIIPCDASNPDSFFDAKFQARQYDIVQVNACLETVADTRDAFSNSIARMASFVKPGGYLQILTGIEATWYTFPGLDHPLYVMAVYKEDVLKGIEMAGLSLVKTIHMERINSRVVTSNVKSFEFTLAQKR